MGEHDTVQVLKQIDERLHHINLTLAAILEHLKAESLAKQTQRMSQAVVGRTKSKTR